MLLWFACSCIFIIFGIVAWNSKKAVSFWNISQQIQVSDVKKYNRAVAKMWLVFAALLAFVGLPVMAGQNSAWMIITVLGTMMLAIALMVVYTRIEKKYRIY